MMDPDRVGATADDHRVVCVLGDLADRSVEIADEIDALLAAMSSDPGTLDWVLERQHYRLAHWREARTRLDRRRFFDVAELVGVRQEDPEVFAATHGRMLLDGGRRADRRCACRPSRRPGRPDRLPRAPPARDRRSLAGGREDPRGPDESLPESWPVDGTTGYEQAAALDRLFVVPSAEAAMTASRPRPSDGCRRCERPRRYRSTRSSSAAEHDALAQLFETELRRLTASACSWRISSTASPATRSAGVDAVDESTCVEHWRALVVACPVYRTYVRPERAADARDRTGARRHVRPCRDDARRRRRRGDVLHDRPTGVRPCRRTAGRGVLRRPPAAAHRGGDGQGRGGHRVLPVCRGWCRRARWAPTRCSGRSTSTSSTPDVATRPRSRRSAWWRPPPTTRSGRPMHAPG